MLEKYSSPNYWIFNIRLFTTQEKISSQTTNPEEEQKKKKKHLFSFDYLNCEAIENQQLFDQLLIYYNRMIATNKLPKTAYFCWIGNFLKNILY